MKKFLCILMALLVMALPLSGLAQTQKELWKSEIANGKSVSGTMSMYVNQDLIESLGNADEETVEMRNILTLYNHLTEQFTVQQGQFSAGMLIDGTEAATYTLCVENGALYIGSNFLEKPIVIDQTEVLGLIENYILPLMVDNGMISQEDADTAKSWIDQLVAGEIPEELQMMLDNLSEYVSAALMAEDDSEETESTGLQISTTNTITWLFGLLASVSEIDANVDGIACSPVVSAQNFTITREDIANLVDAVAADLEASVIPDLDAMAEQYGTDTYTLVSTMAEELKAELNDGPDFSLSLSEYFEENGDVALWVLDILYADEGSTETETVVSGYEAYGYHNDEDNSGEFCFEIVQANDVAMMLTFDWAKSVAEDGTETAVYQLSLTDGTTDYTLSATDTRNTVDLPEEVLDVTLTSGDALIGSMTANASTMESEGNYLTHVIVSFYVGDVDVLGIEANYTTGDAVPTIAADDAARLFSVDSDTLNAWAASATEFANAQTDKVMELMNSIDGLVTVGNENAD